MPAKVDELFDEVKENNPSYSDEQAWATAWSIYCKHVEPGSDSCHLPTSEYLKGKSAAIRVAARYLAAKDSVLDRLEKELGTLKGGRMTWWGYPVEVDDRASDPSHVVIHAVDKDATEELLKLLRKKGFKAKFHKPSGDIVVAAVPKGKWTYGSKPTWTYTSGAYATVGVYALIRYTPGYTKDMFRDAKEDFLKKAAQIAKAEGIAYPLKFEAGFPSTLSNGVETQAFWYRR